jgi:hypothetical protein
MRLLLTMYGSCGNVEPMMGLAVQERGLGTEGEEWDAPIATGVIPAGGWR